MLTTRKWCIGQHLPSRKQTSKISLHALKQSDHWHMLRPGHASPFDLLTYRVYYRKCSPFLTRKNLFCQTQYKKRGESYTFHIQESLPS